MINKTKIIITDIIFIILAIGFIMSLFCLVNGSCEMIPTKEQQEKQHIVSISLSFLFGIASVACMIIRLRIRKKRQDQNGFIEKK